MSREINLTKGKVTIVDDYLYESLSKFKWCVDGRNYAQRNENNKRITMHLFIYKMLGIKIPVGYQVDHINRNKLDNRISNFRIVLPRENAINRPLNKNNTSSYKGVSKHSQCDKWVSQVMVNRKNIYLGLFKDKVDAARAYNTAANNYFGEFATLNKI